jgi:hypothetical protein
LKAPTVNPLLKKTRIIYKISREKMNLNGEIYLRWIKIEACLLAGKYSANYVPIGVGIGIGYRYRSGQLSILIPIATPTAIKFWHTSLFWNLPWVACAPSAKSKSKSCLLRSENANYFKFHFDKTATFAVGRWIFTEKFSRAYHKSLISI